MMETSRQGYYVESAAYLAARGWRVYRKKGQTHHDYFVDPVDKIVRLWEIARKIQEKRDMG